MTECEAPHPEALAQTFAALGDPRRVAIIEHLQKEGTLSLSALCEGADISRQAVSKHLKTMADARLVSVKKSGRETHFSLERERLEAANAFLDRVALQWDHAITRLASRLED